MAHHSPFPGAEDMIRRISAAYRAQEPLGPTGKFPLGKMTPHDEGEIRIAIAHTDGKIVIDFGSPVAWIGFTPEQADEIATLLRTHAQQVREGA